MSPDPTIPACTFSYQGAEISFEFSSAEDHIAKSIISRKTFYEQEMLAALGQHLQADELVIDAGANIGNHTVFFAAICGCKVMAFEPVPATFELLQRNVALNGLQDRVTLYNCALGETASMARIASYDAGNIGGTQLALAEEGDIAVRSIDALPFESAVRLLKVDVEGMDLAVLKGAHGVLETDRPWVVCEASGKAAYEAIRGFMERVGYSPTAVYNATDTYLFLPSRSGPEQKALLEHAFTQVMFLQRDEREQQGKLAQLGRYSERLYREALQTMRHELADAVGAGQVASGNVGGNHLKSSGQGEGPRERVTQLEQQLARANEKYRAATLQVAEQRTRLSELSALEGLRGELEDCREAMRQERQQAADRLRDAQHQVAQYQQEIAELVQKSVQIRRALEDADLAHRHQQGALQLRIAELQADTEAKVAENSRLADDLKKSEHESADRHRRLRDMHGRVASLEQANRQLENAQAQLDELRGSVSYRLGAQVVSGLRSPGGVIALSWRVPRLLWREWRQRRKDA